MQEIIDLYEEQYLKIILYDYEKLSKIYENATLSKKGSSSQEYQNIQKAIDLYMTKLVMSGQLNDNKILNNYKKVFNKTINNDTTYIFSNDLIKIPKERLSYIMNEETYQAIENRKNKIENLCHMIYSKYISGEKISKKEEKLLINYLRENVGTRDKRIFSMQENVIKIIFNNKTDNEYEETDFVVSFIANEESKKYGAITLARLSKYDTYNNLFGKARGVASKNKVNINQEFAINALNTKGEDLALFLHTICHEVKHVDQNSNIKNSVCNEETKNCLYDKLFRSYLSSEDYNYYMSNYYFESGEKSAEIAGFYNAITYIDKYVNDSEKLRDYLLDEKDHQNYIKLIELRRDKDKTKMDADYFRHKKIKDIVKEHPELIKQYKQLSYFFMNDGNLKSFKQQLIEYADFKKQNKKDDRNIYHSTFLVAIDSNELNNIDFSLISKDDTYKIMHSLSGFYNSYAQLAHNTLEAKRRKDKFLNKENDIKNSETYLDESIKKSALRYQKLEKALDAMYEKYGEEYKKIEEYKTDHYIYMKDKKYVHDKYKKISEIQKEIINDNERYNKELSDMLENNSQNTNEKKEATFK